MVAILAITFLLVPASYAAKPMVLGKTYKIKEKDALLEIEERAKSVDWQKTFNEERLNAIKRYQPKDLTRLPRATETHAYFVDMTYTLDMDVPDGKGGILYPKGYTFNPLDYVTYPGVIVVIDASDSDQIAWFERSPYAAGIQTRLLICDGSHYDAAQVFRRPVFYLNEKIASRFQLKAVPSVIRQNGDKMEVRQYDVTVVEK